MAAGAARQAEVHENGNKQKHYDETRGPRTRRKPKTPIEREENEDLEVDETSQATEGILNLRKHRRPAQGGPPSAGLDDPVGEDEVEPEAIDEQMRNQDAVTPPVFMMEKAPSPNGGGALHIVGQVPTCKTSNQHRRFVCGEIQTAYDWKWFPVV